MRAQEGPSGGGLPAISRDALLLRPDDAFYSGVDTLAMGRCRMHGGLSTGPQTHEGRLRSLRAARFFSSDEYFLRVWRRISRTGCSAVPFGGVCFIGLIPVPSTVTMSRNHSVTQTAQTVLWALTGDMGTSSLATDCRGNVTTCNRRADASSRLRQENTAWRR